MRVILLGLAVAALLAARNRRIAGIEESCSRVDNELVTATPFLFEGPEPWSEIDTTDAGEGEPPTVLAYVYTIGPQIRRVFMRITDADNGWREDLLFFFDAGGELIKQTRTLQSPGANITLETVAYYRGGAMLKQVSRHHALTRGKQDSSRFIDPGAPVFLTTDDLPFSDLVDVWRGLI